MNDLNGNTQYSLKSII